jgi:hypothetical protein
MTTTMADGMKTTTTAEGITMTTTAEGITMTTIKTGGDPAIHPAFGTPGGGDGGGILVTAGGDPGGRNIVSPRREESRAIWQKRLLRLAAEGGKEKSTALVGRV